ncbi:MAG: hypothetical protein HYY02_11115 [Chloroflexi bacterium]|nr:hypothetical protein [Chloroflexota bacterium]
MKEILATITSKGQITIPAEVRRHLGVAKRSKVAFVRNRTERCALLRLVIPISPHSEAQRAL